MEASTAGTDYVPALGYRALTPLYDPILRAMFRERTIKTRLVMAAGLKGHERVLDLGCGTGTLTVMLKESARDADVVGIDADPAVLARARAKASEAGMVIAFDEGMARHLPHADESFDAVVTSLMLHHLSREQKAQALREVVRVLRPGGRFLAADFGIPQNRFMRSLAKVSELLEETADGVEGRYPDMFRAAGLTEAEEIARFMTPLGTIALYRALKAG